MTLTSSLFTERPFIERQLIAANLLSLFELGKNMNLFCFIVLSTAPDLDFK